MPGVFSLPRRERLLKKRRYKRIFNNGKRSRSKGLTLVFVNNTSGLTRVGVIAPKAVINLSNRRNRTKRLLREAYRLNKARVKPGMDIAIMAGRQFSSFGEAEEALLSALGKVGLLKPDASRVKE